MCDFHIEGFLVFNASVGHFKYDVNSLFTAFIFYGNNQTSIGFELIDKVFWQCGYGLFYQNGIKRAFIFLP